MFSKIVVINSDGKFFSKLKFIAFFGDKCRQWWTFYVDYKNPLLSYSYGISRYEFEFSYVCGCECLSDLWSQVYVFWLDFSMRENEFDKLISLDSLC